MGNWTEGIKTGFEFESKQASATSEILYVDYN
jgi:hypothetical protein